MHFAGLVWRNHPDVVEHCCDRIDLEPNGDCDSKEDIAQTP